MKTPSTARAFSIRALGWLGLLSACSLAGCGSDDSKDVPIPVPDQFEAYFVAGTVCIPTNVATGTTGPGTMSSNNAGHPIRFDICRHRCITLDRGTAYLEAPWQCPAPGQCNMLLLAHARAYRVQADELRRTRASGSSARDLHPGNLRLLQHGSAVLHERQ